MTTASNSQPIPQRLSAIRGQLELLRGGFDADALAARAEDLEQQMQAPGFWDDQQTAAKVAAEHARTTRRLETWRGLVSDVEDLDALAELAEEDPSVAGEVEENLATVEARLAEPGGGRTSPPHRRAPAWPSSRGRDCSRAATTRATRSSP